MIELDHPQRIFFAGIGGISMSALARILHTWDFTVAGYDRSQNDETAILIKEGIFVTQDENCSLDGYDMLVYTAALKPEHPLLQRALKAGIPLVPRAELLGSIAARYKNSIAVAGTHGKSTTSGLLACIFEYASGTNPTYVVGANLPFIGSTYNLGVDQNFIFEACEYKNSFLQFRPATAVVLNISLDHTDFFKDIDDMIASFRQFVANSASAVINLDSPNAIKATEGYNHTVITFSVRDDKADFYAANIRDKHGFFEFDVCNNGKKLSHLKLAVPGLHNISNAMAAFVCAYRSGIPVKEIESGVAAFHGVSRRFEYLGDINGAHVFDDYAHHPDELNATLSAARELTSGRVIAVFQPHTFSRLKAFFNDFSAALSKADLAVITDVYSAREIDDGSVSGEMLAKSIKGAVFFPTFDEIAAYIRKTTAFGDTVLILGAGDIYKCFENIKKSS